MKFALKLNIYGQGLDTPFSTFVDLARAAEAAGFDGAFTIDHLFLPPERYIGYTWSDPAHPYFLEAWTAIAAIAQATSRIRIGTQVSPVTFRHPSLLAKMGATVDLISGGRLVMQLGTGWHREEHDAYGFELADAFAPRMERLEEATEVIQGLWTSETPFSFDGHHFQIREAPFWPKPVQRPRPPVWFGGTSRRVRRLVARRGDGWSPAMPHGGVGPAAYADGLAEIRTLAEELGRAASDITPALLLTVAIGRTRAEAAERASVLRRRPDYADQSLEDLATVGSLVWGDPDDCLREIEAYAAAGVEYVTLNFVPFGSADAAMAGIELFAERIAPRLPA